MLKVFQILVSDCGRAVHGVCKGHHTVHAAMLAGMFVVALGGCGQRGPLYLPKDAAAKDRATLPDLLTPRLPGAPDAPPAKAATQGTPASIGIPATTATPGTSETTK